jgi:hypothetical protein
MTDKLHKLLEKLVVERVELRARVAEQTEALIEEKAARSEVEDALAHANARIAKLTEERDGLIELAWRKSPIVVELEALRDTIQSRLRERL